MNPIVATWLPGVGSNAKVALESIWFVQVRFHGAKAIQKDNRFYGLARAGSERLGFGLGELITLKGRLPELR